MKNILTNTRFQTIAASIGAIAAVLLLSATIEQKNFFTFINDGVRNVANISSVQDASCSSITQHGITWTFAQSYSCGTYANGDWWVVGPITITDITPKSTDVDGWITNGSQLNPIISSKQGYDSQIDYMNYAATLNVARPNGSDLSASNPLVISNGSLVSTISKSTPSNRPQLRYAAILTVVDSAPSSGAFRPAPVGTNKTSYWNKSQLDYSKLNSLPAVVGTPDLSKVEAYFEKPWMEQNPNWTGRYVHPSGNQPDYGRDMSNRLAEGLLSLQLDYSNAQKETLLIRLVQYGIDVYGAAQAGAVWEDLGGHNQGRKMPLLLAGLVLNDSGMLNYANAAQKFIFQEDRQIWYVSLYDVGRVLYTADGRPREQYILADVGVPEWGEQHTRAERRDGRNWNTYYRNIVGNSIMGQVLTAHLMDAKSAWNWPAVFDYADRFWEIEKDDVGVSTNDIQLFVGNMWEAYRNADAPVVVVADPVTQQPVVEEPVLPIAPSDTDSDGVIDTADQCPGTPAGSQVNSQGCPKIVTSKFAIAPALDSISLQQVAGFKISNQWGKIEWLYPVTLIRSQGGIMRPLNIDLHLSIAKKKVDLDSAQLPELNYPARVTLYGLTVAAPSIKRDGAVCADCRVESYENGTLIFTVPGFSTFEIEEDVIVNEVPIAEIPVATTGSTGESSGGNTGGRGSSSRSSSTSSRLKVSCIVSDTRVAPESVMTISAEVSGGTAPYTFAWGKDADEVEGLDLAKQNQEITFAKEGTYNLSVKVGDSFTDTDFDSCSRIVVRERYSEDQSSVGKLSGAEVSDALDATAAQVPVQVPDFVRDLAMGSRGEDVRNLQKFLNARGFAVSTSGEGSIGMETEYFGPATRSALARYQAASGIVPSSGYFGQLTRKSTNAARQLALSEVMPEDPEAPVLVPASPRARIASHMHPFLRDLAVGSRNEDVRNLQKFLNSRGFAVSTSGEGSVGMETDYFGPATRSALARYQAASGIVPSSGYFGILSRAAVMSEMVLQATQE